MSGGAMTVLGIVFIFVMTALGAALVFFCSNEISGSFQAVVLGFAAGIMTAASVWSMLLPAQEQMQKEWGRYAIIALLSALFIGAACLWGIEKLLHALRADARESSTFNRLFFAVTLHNIPEGLAVGFAFGAAHSLGGLSAYTTALALAIGIGVQNFPEGMAVALPLRAQGKTKGRAFFYGAISGGVEPVAAIIGYFLAAYLQSLQPWLLAGSAGVMLFVVASDLLPSAQTEKTGLLGAWGMIIGFGTMMLLDVILG